MIVRAAVVLLFLCVSVSAQPSGNRHTGIFRYELNGKPICEGPDGRIEWSAKVIGNDTVRFIVDGHQVDTCTIYYDLEFIAEIFDSGGVSKGIHRYSFANQSIRGPMILSNDFSHPGLKIAKVRGISLICKVRNLGSLPGPAGPDSPAMEQAKWLQASFAADKLTYETWSNVKEVEYTEDYIVGTDEMVCSSGSLQDTALPNDQHACAREHQATQALIAEREKKFGKVILPN